jgi:serine/threonine-protein kinase
MSPEQASTGVIDGRSDLFSLGCTMYYLLTGQLAFPGETVVECLKRRASGHPIPITDLRPDLPTVLVEVLNKLIAFRPKDRFQTAAEAAVALQAAAQDGKSDSRIDRISPPHPAVNLLPAEPLTAPPITSEPEPPIGPSDVIAAPSPRSRSEWAFFTTWPTVARFLLQVVLGLVIFSIGFAAGYLSANARQ